MESTSTLDRVKSKLKSSAGSHVLLMLMIAVLMFCLLGCVLSAGESDEEQLPESPSKQQPQEVLIRDPGGIAEQQAALSERTLPPPPAEVMEPPPDPVELVVEDPIQQVEFSDGSWARAYREARGQRREALELLFRCNIISTQEFAYSRVSQEHIDECVWIGTYMLKQKPLEEWVALWQQAQQTFEDSVTACFTARTDARSTYGGPMSGTAPRSEVPLLDCHTATSQVLDPEDADDPYTTRSSLNLSQLISPHPTTEGDVQIPDSQESIDRDLDRGIAAPVPGAPPQRLLSPMILRCREIMAAPPQEGVPAQRIPVLRSSSSATTVPIGGTPGQTVRPEPIAGIVRPEMPGVQPEMPSGMMSEGSSGTPSIPSLSPSVTNISPSMANLSPSIPCISPVQSFGESVFSQAPPTQPHLTPSDVMQRATAAMMRAGVEPPPPRGDGGGALRSRPLPGAPPPMPPGPGPVTATSPPQPVIVPTVPPTIPKATIPQAAQALGKEADRGGGPVVIRTLAESQSEASTAAPSSTQPMAKMHGTPGQVKPPPQFPRISQQAPGSSGEVLVAHVPMNAQGPPTGPPGGPVQLSPLVRIREDRMSGMSSPQSLAGSVVLQRPVAGPPQQDPSTQS